ncbi:MAG: BamA/TamA family outer membrane protein [Cyclobacteriaceae bacterium]|nr:BamA/TamA family outer membrane protein [Cyclobacteriaceae bacterium]MBX2956913.1 BamA/TamA family outer membrane protein [Cyclobacteriaceae bacterium]
MRSWLLFVLVFWLLGNSQAQQKDSVQVDIIDLLFGKKKQEKVDQIRAERKVYFSILPAAVSVPGGGRAVITSINAAFYTGNAEETNLSNIYLIPYTNLGDRYGLYIRPNIWFPKNTINFIGDYRIAHFPQYTWGLGGDTPEWERSLIDSDYLRFYQNALFQINKGYWYVGPGYALDYHYNISESEYTGEGHLDRYEDTPNSSTTSSGVTANLVYDARKNAINPPNGSYIIISWRWNDTKLGSTYTNNSLFIDGRKYIPLSNTRMNLIALRSYYWTILNGETPYLDLPATNWAPVSGISSRGFEIGRYRSNAMVYAEAEHRYQVSRNGLWGLVGFVNLASASEFDTEHFRHWQLAGGVGLRTKLNKFSNANIAIDFGFSQNYWGIWLNIGEMF